MADDRRTDSLDARIARARGDDARPAPRPVDKGYKQGSRVLAELIGAPTGAALIGWLLDKVFHTLPWIMLTMLVLGFVVAFRNVYRIAQEKPE